MNQYNFNNGFIFTRLLNWVQTRCPDLPVHNFTTDWNNGKAVGALVDSVAPGLCPDWPLWNDKDCLANATEAMGLADDWLNVRQLIKPEEMVNPNIDEQSMMTYLSQYPSAKLKQGAPIRPRTNPNRLLYIFYYLNMHSFHNLFLLNISTKTQLTTSTVRI